jgi:hypothetical protein
MNGMLKVGSKLLALITILALSQCRIDKCEEEAPSIEFYKYAYFAADPGDPFAADSLVLYTQFVDCQGDVGLNGSTDTTKNLRTYLYEFIDGEWKRFEHANPRDTVLFFSQVPKSNKLVEDQKAEGIIEQSLGSIRQNSDTIRFEVQLIDRAGNRSNKITTPEFVFPN